MSELDNGIYTTKSGHELKIKIVKPLKIQRLQTTFKNRFTKNDEPIDPPYYYVKLAGGGRQRHYYNEKTIRGDNVPESDKKAWKAHRDALDRMETEIEERGLEILFIDGIEFDLPEDESWIEIHEYQGFDVPAHPQIRKVHYLLTEVLETGEAIELATIIMNRSQTEAESRLQEAESLSESFPDQMENENGTQIK